MKIYIVVKICFFIKNMQKNNQSETTMFEQLGKDVYSFLDNVSSAEDTVLKTRLEDIKNDIKNITKKALMKSLEESDDQNILSSSPQRLVFSIDTNYGDILNDYDAEEREKRLIGRATQGVIAMTIKDLEKILDKKLRENTYRDEILKSNSYENILDILGIRRMKIGSKIMNFENADGMFESNRIWLLLYILWFEYNHTVKVYGNETEAHVYDETINKTFIVGNNKGYKTYIADWKKDLYDTWELSREEAEQQFITWDFYSAHQRESLIKNIVLDTNKQDNQSQKTEEVHNEQKKQDPRIQQEKTPPQAKTKPIKKIKENSIEEPSIKSEAIVAKEEIATEEVDKEIDPGETEQSRVQKLDTILAKEKNARPWQKETWESTKNMLKRGINRWTIVLPCSSGKTRTVTELLKIDNATKLYLLPKNVIGISVVEDLVKWGISAEKIIDCTNGTWEIKLNTLDVSKIWDHVIVANYRWLLSLRKKNKSTFDQLISKTRIILSDEAHRSLGAETRETIDECMAVEWLIHTSEIDVHNKKLHVLFTSTPKLLFKEIADYYPHTIITKTMEEVYVESIKYGIESPLVLPKFRRMGPVYLTLDKLVNYTWSDINEDFFTKYANKVRVFVDRDWNPLETKMFHEYIKLKKENGGYAPGLWVCNTIEQAQRFTEYFQKKGIQARRCTGPNKTFDTDLEYSELKDFVDKGGVVFTADAITEWVNIPSLRIIMECAYTWSPARVVQSIWRITRSISDKEVQYLKKLNPHIDESNLKKTHANTVCLWPTMRWGDYEPREQGLTGTRNKPGIGWNTKKRVPLRTFYDFMLDLWEMGSEKMTKEWDLLTGEEKLSVGNTIVYGKFKSPNLWDLLKNDLKKYSRDPLDQESEKIAIEKYKQWDEEAKEILIKANVRFVLFKAKKRYYYYKKRYPQMHSTINDFVSAWFEWLLEAIQNIDECKFDTKSSFMLFIQNYLSTKFRALFYDEENCTTKISGIHVPVYARSVYEKTQDALDKKDDDSISAIENNLPNKNEIILDGLWVRGDVMSKCGTRIKEGTESLENIENSAILQDMSWEIWEEKTDESLKKESLYKEVMRSLNTLTEREADIIRWFFGIGTEEKTLEELGVQYWLTRERVRQIQEKALRRLRNVSRSKLLREYIGDQEIDSVSNLSSNTGALQSMWTWNIYPRNLFTMVANNPIRSDKTMIVMATWNDILATNILTFMQMHSLPNEMVSDILDLNIIRVAQLRKKDLTSVPHGVVTLIENALKKYGLSLDDENIKAKVKRISFRT